MKELTIEQKAKAYDEALKRAIKHHDRDGLTLEQYETIDIIFPELKESKESKDERIRKALISVLKSDFEKDTTIYDISVGNIIAWLEKQGDKRLINFDEAEKEKNDFVSGQFIECRKSFNEFKEHNSYWLEYLGDDDYIGRSDNILNQKFHITPRQLFTLFTQQHCPKEDNTNEETNAPTGYGKYIDECLNEAAKRFFSEGEDTYSVADLFYAGVRCGKSLFEKQGEQKVDYTTLVETGNGGINALITRELSTDGCDEQKTAWSEEDEKMLVDAYVMLDWYKGNNWWTARRIKDWLKSLKTRYTWKPSDEQIEILDMVLTNESMDDNIARILRELREQLKKLREE